MSNLKSSIDSVKDLQSLLSDVQTAIELAELEVRTIHQSLPIFLACKLSYAHFLYLTDEHRVVMIVPSMLIFSNSG